MRSSAVFAVARCPSVRPSLSRIVSRQLKKISSNFFLSPIAHNSSFLTPCVGIQVRWEPLQRGGGALKTVWEKLRFSNEIAVYLGDGTS